MGRNDCGNARRSWPIVIAAGMAVSALPAFAQHAATGHASTGHIVATRPMAPGRSVGGPVRSGPRLGTIHPNSFGSSSAPPPSWELPKNVTPHWEIPSNIHVQPNPVQGNRLSHGRLGNGVGYVGLPYYVDPMAFVDADTGDDTGTDAGQQAQPGAPGGYAPQAPYAEAPYDQGYAPPPPRAPYAPDGNPPPPQNNAQSPAQSAAAQSDGLDHPAVTLVFNDGRPPVKVHSYVLTGSSVFVAENGHQRVIPVADLDLPATVAQNREAGVDFELPGRQVR
ncbi:MAG: hypothetical protein QOK38_2903 [Acidobacteriaceae bacterium]|nr:hypothetical protein [Acidobacteriaceae bacterium]